MRGRSACRVRARDATDEPGLGSAGPRARVPVSGRVVAERKDQHRAECGPFASGADARGALKIAGHSAHQVDPTLRGAGQDSREHVRCAHDHFSVREIAGTFMPLSLPRVDLTAHWTKVP